MSTENQLAVSDAMREAVARLAEYLKDNQGRWSTHEQQAEDLLIYSPIASEIARLTGERDAARERAEHVAGKLNFIGRKKNAATKRAETAETEVKNLRKERDAARADWAKLSFACGNEWQRAEAAEAETARLRAALEDAADALGWAATALREDENDAAAGVTLSAAQNASAAITSQEQADV